MNTSYLKHSKILSVLVVILSVLILVGCQCGGESPTEPKDTTPPVIMVPGFTNEQTTNVVAGDGFEIPGATAIDDVDGTVAVMTNDNEYDNNLTNTYSIVYTAADIVGNSSVFILRVIVGPDITPPIITVAGFTNGQTTNVEVKEGFEIPGATAIDNIDGPVAISMDADSYDNGLIGTYNVSYSASDSAGNSSTFTLTIIVEDTTPPDILVDGFNNGQMIDIEVSMGFEIPGAVAIDTLDGLVAVTTNDDGYNNDVTNTYSVVYTASDNAGNSNTFTLVIVVSPDVTLPIITVVGFTNGQKTNVEIGMGFAIPEATATDNIDGSVAVITNRDGYDNNAINTYSVVYTASDNAGNSNTFTLVIVVSPDVTPPIITVAGGVFTNGQTTNVEVKEGFAIPEAIAIDDVDGLVAVMTNNGGYNNDNIGTYFVVYRANDAVGNLSIFTLTIIVEDTTPPAITVMGFTNGQATNVQDSNNFAIPEATAIDNVDGQVAVTTNDDRYNDQGGVYNVEYSATDRTGNSSTFRLTITVEDTMSPVVFLTNEVYTNGQTINVEVKGGFAIPEAVALDNADGLVAVTTNDDEYNNDVPNTYVVVYTAEDTAGNSSAFTLTIIVEDTTPPDITVMGFTNGQTTNVEDDDRFEIPEATATDNFDRLVAVFTNSHGFNNIVTNTYTVVYTATDNAGNATDFTLIIIVEDIYDSGGFHRVSKVHRNTGTANNPDGFDVNGIHRNIAKILADDKSAGDQFGSSVAISGNYAIVGADSDDVGANDDIGSAYILIRNGTNWTQQAKLTANDGSRGVMFGSSVAIDGDYAIVGAPLDVDIGSAYIFKRSGTNWIQQAKLTANDGNRNDEFGSSVSISINLVLDTVHAIVGAPFSTIGSAYIFAGSGTNWMETQKLTASDGNDVDFYGFSVAISGNYAIVGAYGKEDGGSTFSFAGAVYFYRIANNDISWFELHKSTASDHIFGHNTEFGRSVAIDGGYAIVGARGRRSAYIFYLANGSLVNWTEQAILTPSEAVSNVLSLSSVAIDGNYVILGASSSGSAYVFNRIDSNWMETQKLTANDGVAGDEFGGSVAIDGDGGYGIIGAHSDDDVTSGTNTGSVYIYQFER